MVTRTGDREIGVVSGRLPDDTGELACMSIGNSGSWKKVKPSPFVLKKIIIPEFHGSVLVMAPFFFVLPGNYSLTSTNVPPTSSSQPRDGPLTFLMVTLMVISCFGHHWMTPGYIV